ncbi:MAG: ABC transporter permease subunit [Rhodospirillaceae bacterium]
MTILTPKGAIWPWWRRCLVVLDKEMRDHLRDRRSLSLALIYPLLGPMVIAMLLQISADSIRMGPGSRVVTVAAQGVAYAPQLVDYLARYKVTLTEGVEATASAQVKVSRNPVILEIPPEAANSDHFTVRLLFDANNTVSAGTVSWLSEVIYGYGRQVSQRLLTTRGIDVAVLQPVTVERVHTGRRLNMALLFYNLIPPLVVFMTFLGAVYLALDTTVGERERGTLEPLLTAPVRRWELLLGKAAAAFLFTLVTVAVNLAAFRLVLGLLASSVPGLEAPPSSATFLLMFVMALPVMALAVTVQMTVAAIARSMKEAQIYLGLLPLLPALPGVASAITPFAPQLWIASVPVFGQMVMFGRLIAGTEIDPLQALLSAATTLLATALLFRWATYLYEQERNVMPG